MASLFSKIPTSAHSAVGFERHPNVPGAVVRIDAYPGSADLQPSLTLYFPNIGALAGTVNPLAAILQTNKLCGGSLQYVHGHHREHGHHHADDTGRIDGRATEHSHLKFPNADRRAMAKDLRELADLAEAVGVLTPRTADAMRGPVAAVYDAADAE